MEALVGPLAMNICEPRQARKGATVVVTSCAEVWLMRAAAIPSSLLFTRLKNAVSLYMTNISNVVWLMGYSYFHVNRF